MRPGQHFKESLGGFCHNGTHVSSFVRHFGLLFGGNVKKGGFVDGSG